MTAFEIVVIVLFFWLAVGFVLFNLWFTNRMNRVLIKLEKENDLNGVEQVKRLIKFWLKALIPVSTLALGLSYAMSRELWSGIFCLVALFGSAGFSILRHHLKMKKGNDT